MEVPGGSVSLCLVEMLACANSGAQFARPVVYACTASSLGSSEQLRGGKRCMLTEALFS